MSKGFELNNLFRDLEYTLFGTEVHQFLFKVFPPEENKRVLEAGCGCGKFGIAYAILGCDVTMIDVDQQVLAYARRVRDAANSLNGHASLTYIRKCDLHKMKYEDNTFDLVFNEGVPHHWPDEEKRQGSINQMVRVSKDTVMVIGNNGANPSEVESYKDVEFTYKGMPPKTKFFTPDELEMRLRRAGLKRVQIEGISPGRIEDSVLIGGYGHKE